jgi:hypothetical protein
MHATTNTRRDKQSLSFLCSRLTPNWRRELAFCDPSPPAGSADLDSFDSRSQLLVGAYRSRLITSANIHNATTNQVRKPHNNIETVGGSMESD